MAQHFRYYDDWKSVAFECPKCGWKGTFDEGAVQYFNELMDCSCPQCETMLAIVSYPTLKDTRANWSKLSETEREHFKQIDKQRLDLARSGEIPTDTVFKLDTKEEVDRFFDDSSLASEGKPQLVIIMGGPSAGKTTIRRQHFSTGYVLVDAAEVFRGLSRGESLPFPDGLEGLMEAIGQMVAGRAVSERRHIVTELIGADLGALEELAQAMRAVGYEIVVRALDCDIEVAKQRNLNRSDDNVPCYYAEPYHRLWLLEAARSSSNAPRHRNID